MRLLGGPQTDAISVNIFRADLSNLPSYKALSYVVGSMPPTEQIGLRLQNGDIGKLQITPHLEYILRTLRYPDRDRIIWVDALSIAQENVEEKAEQIQNVGRIFQQATNVCVWLGLETAETTASMDFIPRLLDFDNLDASFDRKDTAQKGWISLARLMTVPYFSRRWIVQELAFARKATVYCGSRTVDWLDLVNAAVLLEKHWPTLVSRLSHEERDQLGDIHAPGAMSLVQLTTESLQKAAGGQVLARLASLEFMLTSLPMFDTKLQHDAIYSILSLGCDTYQRSLRVDYNQDPVELFADVVVMTITRTGSLDMICRPWAPFVKHGQPSWIGRSDRYPFFKSGNGQYDRRNADSLVGKPERPIYQASRAVTSHTGFRRNKKLYGQTLTVRGVELGIISTSYEKSQHGSIPDDWLQCRETAYQMIVTAEETITWHNPSMRAVGIRDGQVREVLWRTLFADLTKDGQVAPRWYIRACHHCLSRTGEHWGEQAVNIERLINRSPAKLGAVLTRIRETIWGRKLFQYRHHTFDEAITGPGLDTCRVRLSLGLGPGGLHEGDVVAVLLGCSVPVILRKSFFPPHIDPRLTRYDLVGEAYIYGFMDGEALETREDGTYLRTEKEFEIF